ncbi:MAG: hypothetical protein HY589_01215 [Candidatus Omnitrophica bacterium]|nr:hypothetical protein [Candidatus Omnitrophota bacterium]
MKKLLLFAFIGAMLGVCLMACAKKSTPGHEHPAAKGAVSEHPKSEHPGSEHPK